MTTNNKDGKVQAAGNIYFVGYGCKSDLSEADLRWADLRGAEMFMGNRKVLQLED
jgi:uncharacterized protein YjbI with pentapeptide repeats